MGAPEDQSDVQSTVSRGGAVYRCDLTTDSCEQVIFDHRGELCDEPHFWLMCQAINIEVYIATLEVLDTGNVISSLMAFPLASPCHIHGWLEIR